MALCLSANREIGVPGKTCRARARRYVQTSRCGTTRCTASTISPSRRGIGPDVVAATFRWAPLPRRNICRPEDHRCAWTQPFATRCHPEAGAFRTPKDLSSSAGRFLGSPFSEWRFACPPIGRLAFPGKPAALKPGARFQPHCIVLCQVDRTPLRSYHPRV